MEILMSVVIGVCFAAAVYLLLVKRWQAALFVLGAVMSGIALSTLMKSGFDRPRPDLVPHESHVYSASFPSGHSMMAAVVYLTLGALLARIHSRRRVKTFFLALAILGAMFTLFLAERWPTEVVAIGAAIMAHSLSSKAGPQDMTLLDVLPMAIGIPDFSITWGPFATSFITGLLFATVMTLLVVPVLYQVVERLKRRLQAWSRQRLAARGAASEELELLQGEL